MYHLCFEGGLRQRHEATPEQSRQGRRRTELRRAAAAAATATAAAAPASSVGAEWTERDQLNQEYKWPTGSECSGTCVDCYCMQTLNITFPIQRMDGLVIGAE